MGNLKDQLGAGSLPPITTHDVVTFARLYSAFANLKTEGCPLLAVAELAFRTAAATSALVVLSQRRDVQCEPPAFEQVRKARWILDALFGVITRDLEGLRNELRSLGLRPTDPPFRGVIDALTLLSADYRQASRAGCA